MFEHLRAELNNQLAQAHAATQAATAAVDQANSAVTQANANLQTATQALAQAQAAAAAAAAAVAAAQATVTQRQGAHDTAQGDLDSAQADLDQLEGEFSPGDGPPGRKPPPGWAAAVANARTKVAAAQKALDATVAPLQQAQQQLQAATQAAAGPNAAREAAQTQRDAAASALTSAQGQVSARTTARDQTAQTEAAITAQLTALDARAARILAEPLNRADLEQAADAELAGLLALRAKRRDLYVQRASAVSDRGVALSAQDAVADQVQALAGLLRTWPDAGRYPQIAGVITALDGIVSASQTQRQKPPQGRTDDLPGVQSTLSAQLGQLNAAAAHANAEQTTLTNSLSQAAKALAAWEAAS